MLIRDYYSPKEGFPCRPSVFAVTLERIFDGGIEFSYDWDLKLGERKNRSIDTLGREKEAECVRPMQQLLAVARIHSRTRLDCRLPPSLNWNQRSRTNFRTMLRTVLESEAKQRNPTYSVTMQPFSPERRSVSQ